MHDDDDDDDDDDDIMDITMLPIFNNYHNLDLELFTGCSSIIFHWPVMFWKSPMKSTSIETAGAVTAHRLINNNDCLLYTSDAADE